MIRVLFLYVLPLAFTIYAFVDAALSPRERVRTMSKWLWLVLIALLPVVGGIAWFLFGRPARVRQAGPGSGGPGGSGGGPGGGSGGSGPSGSGGFGGGFGRRAPRRPASPDDDPAFLRHLEEQAWIERQRRRREPPPPTETTDTTPLP